MRKSDIFNHQNRSSSLNIPRSAPSEPQQYQIIFTARPAQSNYTITHPSNLTSFKDTQKQNVYILNEQKSLSSNRSRIKVPKDFNEVAPQALSNLEISDLREELVKKSVKIQELLTNSAKRLQKRSYSPSLTFSNQNILQQCQLATNIRALTPQIPTKYKIQQKNQISKEQNDQKTMSQSLFDKQFTQQGVQNIQNIQNKLNNEKTKLETISSQIQKQLGNCSVQITQFHNQNKSQTCSPFNTTKSQACLEQKKIINSQSPAIRKKTVSLSQDLQNEKILNQKGKVETQQKPFELKKIITSTGISNQNDINFVERSENRHNEAVKLKKDLQQQQEINERLVRNLSNLEIELQDIKQKFLDVSNESICLKQEKQQLISKFSIRKEENLPCQKSIESKRRTDHYKEKALQSENNLMEFEKQIKELNTQLSNEKSKSQQLQTEKQMVQEQMQKLQEENSKLLSDIQYYIEKDKENQNIISQKEKQEKDKNSCFAQQEQILRSQLEKTQIQLSSLISAKEKLEMDNKNLIGKTQQKLQQQIQQIECQMQTKYNQLESKLIKQENQLNSFSQTLKKKLTEDLQSLMELSQQMQEQAEIGQEEIILESQDERVQQLENDLNQLLTQRQELEYMLQKSQEYHQSKIEELQEILDYMQNDKNQCQQQIIQIKQIVTNKEEEHQNLQKVYDQLQEQLELQRQEAAYYKQQFYQQKSLNIQLSQENDELNYHAEQYKSNYMHLQLQNEEEIQKEIENAAEVYEKYQEITTLLSGVTCELPDTQQKMQEQTKKIFQFQNEIQALHQQLNDLQKQQSTQIKLIPNNQEGQRFQPSVSDLENVNRNLQTENLKINEEIKNKNENKSNKKFLLQEEETQNNQEASTQPQFVNLQEQINDLKQQIQQANTKLQDQENQIQQGNSKVAYKEKQIQNLNQKHEVVCQKYNQQTQALNKLSSQFDELQSQKEALERQTKNAEQCFKSVALQIVNLSNQESENQATKEKISQILINYQKDLGTQLNIDYFNNLDAQLTKTHEKGQSQYIQKSETFLEKKQISSLSLEQENQQLKLEILQLNEKILLQQTQLKESELQNNQLLEIRNLQTLNSRMSEENLQLKEIHKKLTNEINLLQTQNQKLVKQSQNLEQNIQTLTSQNKQLSQSLENLQDKLKNIKKENQQMEQELQAQNEENQIVSENFHLQQNIKIVQIDSLESLEDITDNIAKLSSVYLSRDVHLENNLLENKKKSLNCKYEKERQNYNFEMKHQANSQQKQQLIKENRNSIQNSKSKANQQDSQHQQKEDKEDELKRLEQKLQKNKVKIEELLQLVQNKDIEIKNLQEKEKSYLQSQDSLIQKIKVLKTFKHLLKDTIKVLQNQKQIHQLKVYDQSTNKIFNDLQKSLEL